MNFVLVLPIVIPLAAASVSLIVWRRPFLQRWIALAGATALLLAGIALLASVRRAGIVVAMIGGWPAPYGITLVADLFSAIMVALAGLAGLAVTVYSLEGIDTRREAFGYYPLLHILLMGVCGAFLTGDMFNLYVWFEVMLIASFVLLALGGRRAQLEGAIKYVTINLLSSAVFLAAIGLLYGMVGTLNMADLADKFNDLAPGVTTTVAMLFLVAFGVKAAVFPLFFWLPASYHTPPMAVSALFAGLLTKVGVYGMIRAFTLLFVHDLAYTHNLLLAIAGLTMVIGVLGAMAQQQLPRIFSFLIISHVGFPIMGLGFYTRLGLAGSVFYLIEDIIVLTTLFMVAGMIRRIGGADELKSLGGLYRAYPSVGLLFLLPALSVSGVPPLSGFFAKLALLQPGLADGHYLIVATALVVSLLTLSVIARIWAEVFWKPAPAPSNGATTLQMLKPHGLRLLMIPTMILAGFTVLIGLGAEPVFVLALEAGEQLLDRSMYINAVLGGVP